MRMLKSLYWKLTLAFMLVAFTSAALVGLFIRLTSADRLTQLIIDQNRSSLQTSLSAYYVENGSWSGIDQKWQDLQFHNFPRPDGTQVNPLANNNTGSAYGGGANNNGNHPPGGPNRENPFGLTDATGKVIVPVDPAFPAGATLPAHDLSQGTQVLASGKVVGTIIMAHQPPGFNQQENMYLQRTNEALIYAMLGALVVALVIGILLARTLTGPLQALTKATQSISRGQWDQQVKVTSNDEIGQLAAAFNSMSQEVGRVNQQRRQMTADIAHDLRTPLTVISGYVESMRDGVLKPTTQRLSLIYSEIERLQNLVGDLRMLSLADAGELPLNPQMIDPKNLLDRAASLFCHQAEQQGVTIDVEASEDLPVIRWDEARMMQVLGNLVSNSLRYTPEEGKITLSAAVQDHALEICVQDSGVGIDPNELPYIFDRFRRADKSRHSESGESGLGLAIVKALVESHGGSARAESIPEKGTLIRLIFPIPEAEVVAADKRVQSSGYPQ
jgi:two-component system, OmpR family, sensor histidine kinase BaeS